MLEAKERRELEGEHEEHEGENEGKHVTCERVDEGGYVGHVAEAHGEMEVDISGWHGMDRQERKDARRRAKQRKAESREEQQQVGTGIGGEAVQQERGEEERKPGGPAEFVAMWGDEKRRALDGNFYTASEFCSFYRDKYTVETLWHGQFGNGIENEYMLEHAQHEFAYLM